MKIVERRNVDGASIYVNVHVSKDTESSIHNSSEDESVSILKIGTVNIFASDEDLTILASAIGDHIRKKYMPRM